MATFYILYYWTFVLSGGFGLLLDIVYTAAPKKTAVVPIQCPIVNSLSNINTDISKLMNLRMLKIWGHRTKDEAEKTSWRVIKYLPGSG